MLSAVNAVAKAPEARLRLPPCRLIMPMPGWTSAVASVSVPPVTVTAPEPRELATWATSSPCWMEMAPAQPVLSRFRVSLPSPRLVSVPWAIFPVPSEAKT